MTPYYGPTDGITIYHGDCLDVIEAVWGDRVNGRPFDLLLTDPPYGHGERWAGGTWASDPMYADAMKWDKKTNPVALALARRLCRDQIVWGGNYYDLPLSRCWLSWVKSSSMDTLADFELAWTNFDKPSKLLREDRNADGKRVHPTQKPESVMLWALTKASNVRTVLDPFMGSGTTLVVAKRLGKTAVGIDLSEAYCEIAAKRLSQGALALEMP